MGIHGLDEIKEALKSGRQAGKLWSVPANGLTLEEVNYPPEITGIWKTY
jgi:hypothetical protein